MVDPSEIAVVAERGDRGPVEDRDRDQRTVHEKRPLDHERSDEGEDDIKLHFDRERPQRPAERAKRDRRKDVHERGMGYEMCELLERTVEPIAERDGEDDECEEVRWQDLERTLSREVRGVWHGRAVTPRSRIGERDAEAAQEKE